MGNNEFAIGNLFDQSKAFDKVNHTTLLSKLKCCGIRVLAHQWLYDYLRDRMQ